MPVLADFTVITSSTKVVDEQPRKWTFNTGGRQPGGKGLLMLETNGVPPGALVASVRLNGQELGKIETRTSEGFITRLFTFDGSVLKDGDNELQIDPAMRISPPPTSGDLTAGFTVRHIVCFFNQAA